MPSNMSLIVEAASLLSAVDDDEYREISDILLAFANYANEAHKMNGINDNEKSNRNAK
jgi:hypothetical protein